MGIETHPPGDAVDWLRSEYARRRARNPSYSLRAFARHLSMAPGALSELLARKRRLTAKCAARLALRMGLAPDESARFVAPFGAGAAVPEPESYRLLTADTFSVIADWEHFAILSLMETEDFNADPRWVGRRLGITATEVRAAMDRLRRLGLVRLRAGRLVPTSGWTTTQDIPSEALRRSHRQGLEQAIAALDDVPVEERDITAITMAVDPAKLPEAKALIRRFRRTLARLMETGRQSEVYNLNVQLVPVTKNASRRESSS